MVRESGCIRAYNSEQARSPAPIGASQFFNNSLIANLTRKANECTGIREKHGFTRMRISAD